MAALGEVSPLVEPLSLDEAYLDLSASALTSCDLASVTALGQAIRATVHEVSGGLTASVGIGTSRLIAKIASDLDKPDGLVVVAPGTELELLRPMPVTVIPGVGPATAERLRRAGVHTFAELGELTEADLIRELGQAHGHGLHLLAQAIDHRPIVPEREAKSVSVEGTYDEDLTDRTLLDGLITRQAATVAERLRKHGLSGRTITIKVRLHDFTTINRSSTLPSPTDNAQQITRLARALLAELMEAGETVGGVRLLGVGVSGLADWVQDDLFGDEDHGPEPTEEPVDLGELTSRRRSRWWPGQDVVHDDMGPGWVWGSGKGVVTVRFETAETDPGPVRTFAIDDEALQPLAPAREPDSAPE